MNAVPLNGQPSLNGEPAFDSASSDGKLLKRLIWVYFWMLLFEGVLRKWLLPGLANPLLIIRDPVVILIYFVALYKGKFPTSGWVSFIIVLGFISGVEAVVLAHGPVVVVIYGLRANFLHLPLMFLIPNVFSIEDVKSMGKWLLITAAPMAVLVLLQFLSDSSSLLNTGAGGGGGGQMESAFGRVRPAGTFSFTNGMAMYLAFITAFLLYAATRKALYPRSLVLVGILSALLMIGLSGSRAVLASVTILMAILLIICLYKPRFFGDSLKFVLFVVIAYVVFGTFSVFQEGLSVHEYRLGSGGGVKTGMVDRYFGDYLDGFRAISGTPLQGFGLGLGTNAAAGLLSGERGFLLAEGEWARVVKESGPILGFAYLFFRVFLTCAMAVKSSRWVTEDNLLPILLFGAAAPQLLTGQFGQPTTLGFACLGGGLCLAACRSGEPVAPEPPAPLPVRPPLRGRSAYAEYLHSQ